MATAGKDYVGIADTEVDAGSPTTTSLGTRWRDDPIAGMQGDPDAKTAASTVWLGVDRSGGSTQYGAITDETSLQKVLKPDGSGSVVWGTVAPPLSWNIDRYVYTRAYNHSYGDTGAESTDFNVPLAQVVDRASRLALLPAGQARTKQVLDTTPAFQYRNPMIRRDGATATGSYSDSWGGTAGRIAGTEEFETQFGELEEGCVIILGGTHDDGAPFISYGMGIKGVKITKDGSDFSARFYGSWCLANDDPGDNDPANSYVTTASKDAVPLFTLSTTDSSYTEKVRAGNTKGKGILYGHLSVSGDYLIAYMRVEASEGTDQAGSENNRGGAGVWWRSVLEEDQI